MLQQYQSTERPIPREQARNDYDTIASTVPASVLGSVIGPDAFNQAMTFFSEHPTLVKVLGTMAIAKSAQHLTARPH